MPPLATTHSLAHLLEFADAAACKDLSQAVPPSMGEQFGIRVQVRNDTVLAMASHIDVLTFNRVVGLGLTKPVTESDLDIVISCYRKAEVRRFFVQVSPAAQPLTLLDWLHARDIKPYNVWMKLYRRAERYSEDDTGDHTADTGTSLRVEPGLRAQAGTFGAIAASAFGMPGVAAQWLGNIVERAGWHCYLAYDQETPIGAAAMYVNGDYAWLGIAGTLESARRRGAQTALIRHRVNSAHALGCRWVVVETAEDTPARPAPSFHNLRRLGFTVAYPRVNYLYQAAVPST